MKPRPLLTAGLLAAAVLPGGAAAADVPYLDPALPVDRRVEDLLGRMTLEEKVAQLQPALGQDPAAWDEQGDFVAGRDAPLFAAGPASYFNLPAFLKSVGTLTPAAAARHVNSLQDYARAHSRLGIPLFTFGEAVHGYLAPGATSFPSAIALGSTWDPALLEQLFTAVAAEATARGTRQVLSPVLDLARDPRWGRFEECYGEDPYLVSRLGLAAIRGLQGPGPAIGRDRVAVTLKHFAGHGQPEGGRNLAPVGFAERDFRENHLLPFEVAVRRGGAAAIMASYNEWDGVPNHVNRRLLTDILRGEWGFRGFVMSDGNGLDTLYEVHHAAAGPVDAGRLALAAGLDYDLASKGCFSSLAAEVRAGTIPLAEVDRAVRRVLRIKFLCGLFEDPHADPARVAAITNSPAHRALALQAAEEAMVLLKNDARVLPFDPARIKTLAVIGPNAADIHLGGYSAVPMRGVSVLAGLKEFAADRGMEIRYAEGCKLTLNKECDWRVNQNPVLSDPTDDRRLIAAAAAVARSSDAVVLVLGENELLCREAWGDDHLGDRDSLDLVGRQNELAEAILATGRPVAVLLLNGRPLSVNALAQHAPAIVECWYLGEETGRAVANVLFGRVSPSGKLTVTVPRSAGQLPCYYDRQPSRFRNYELADSAPLFPFGFGLSYTTFAYRNLRLEPATIPSTGSTRVSVDVANTGAARADEIVQLYIHQLVGVPVRPVEELKDFARITLAPGETRTVTFTLTPDKLSALGLDLQPVVPPGDYEIMVGRSSVDTLKGTLTVR